MASYACMALHIPPRLEILDQNADNNILRLYDPSHFCGRHVADAWKETSWTPRSTLLCTPTVNNDVNADGIESILEHMKKKLQSISNDRNNLSRARQKALSILSSFNKTIQRPEIQNVLQAIIKKSEAESRKLLYKEAMKIENINDKMSIAPDTRLTEELKINQTEVETDEDDSEGDDEKDHFNFQTDKNDFDDELDDDGEKSPVVIVVERRESRSSSLNCYPFTYNTLPCNHKKIDTGEQILLAAKDSLVNDEIKFFKKFIPVFKEFKEKQKTNVYSCSNDDVMDIRGNSEFANYLSVDQYAELLSVKPKRDANIPASWRRVIDDYYTDSINDKKKSIDDWVCVTNDLIVLSEKDTDETAQIKKYLYIVMSPLIESFCKPIPAISAHNTSEHHYWSEFGHRFFSRALDDFVGLDWRAMEVPVHASKYRKNHGLDHIAQKVVDGKSADILAWTESGEEVFVGEQSGPPTKLDLTKFATDSFKLYRELRDCLNVRILHAMEIGDTNYSNRIVFGVLGQLFEINMLLMWKDGVYIYEEFGSLTIASHCNKIYTMKTGMIRLLEFILVIKDEVTKKFEASEYDNDKIQFLKRKFREILPTRPSPIKKSKLKDTLIL
ncbi:4355_t:CDS:10 [Funneliformis geosporum]|uniref:4355_t:CDS:1 n=1 Tax=Funneliformis geosporum TaxID=1117311 RepID=A0A9W4WQA4_9GLOM|nr:4355_t:CDS:10 [Funneliformis geosporum]